MADIMETFEKKEIRPLEVPERVAIYVYYTSHKGARQLARFGEVIYTSQKSHYSLLYVEDQKLSALLEQLKSLKFVRKVRISHLKEMNKNFSEAFVQTNLEVKNELN